jgi:hypothetical protein
MSMNPMERTRISDDNPVHHMLMIVAELGRQTAIVSGLRHFCRDILGFVDFLFDEHLLLKQLFDRQSALTSKSVCVEQSLPELMG